MRVNNVLYCIMSKEYNQAAVVVTPNTVSGRLFACRLHYGTV